jgi:uncharacterized membrane protein
MNLHPIFVHFPIALLTLYTLCELLRFKKIKEHPAWFYLKAVLVICGTAGATVALFTGSEAKKAVLTGIINAQVANPRMVINLHETWAKGASLIYLLLAAAYAVAWLNKFKVIDYLPGKALKEIWQIGTQIQKLLIETNLVIVLSVAGLIAITIAGALGGSIIYGPNTDPVVQFIYRFIVQ